MQRQQSTLVEDEGSFKDSALERGSTKWSWTIQVPQKGFLSSQLVFSEEPPQQSQGGGASRGRTRKFNNKTQQKGKRIYSIKQNFYCTTKSNNNVKTYSLYCMKEQSTIRAMVAEANHKVSNCIINISLEPYNHKELEDTLTLLVSESTPTLIAVEPFLGHQLTIQGIPIFHVTLTQFHQPWIQPLRMGKASIAAEYCLSQPFAGRISLLQLNWKVEMH